MRSGSLSNVFSFGLLILLGALTVGCGPQAEKAGDGKSGAAASDPHAGWWCKEHGVPEKECSMCDSAVAAKFKEQGDWCEEHNRAESQCFKCDPARAEKFVKLYAAKIGGKPPKATEN